MLFNFEKHRNVALTGREVAIYSTLRSLIAATNICPFWAIKLQNGGYCVQLTYILSDFYRIDGIAKARKMKNDAQYLINCMECSRNTREIL